MTTIKHTTRWFQTTWYIPANSNIYIVNYNTQNESSFTFPLTFCIIGMIFDDCFRRRTLANSNIYIVNYNSRNKSSFAFPLTFGMIFDDGFRRRTLATSNIYMINYNTKNESSFIYSNAEYN